MAYNEPPLERNELDSLRDLVDSDNWKEFRRLLQAHREYLEKQVIITVRCKNMDEAARFEARASECGVILQLITDRLAELKKSTKQEGFNDE